MSLSEEDLSKVLQFSVSLARKAGNIIREGSESIHGETINEKKNAGSPDLMRIN